MRTTVLLLVLLNVINGYKIVFFVLDLSMSQVIFNKRIAETLADRGHNVTMVLIKALDETRKIEIPIKENINLYTVNGSIGVTREEFENQQTSVIFEDYSLFDRKVWRSAQLGRQFTFGSCRNILRNVEFLTWLKEQHFDLAFLYAFQACPVGLVYIGRIPSWIWLISSPLLDHVAQRVGVPSIPSYVPPMGMECHDTMNFYERTKSFLGHFLTYLLWGRFIVDPETQLFREIIDPSFPDLEDLAKQCPLVMVNSNELYDLPRPSLAKVVNIGGMDMHYEESKPLPTDIAQIASSADAVVVFSFGSITPITKMPREWKIAFFRAFSKFPKVHFFVKYIGDDMKDIISENVHLYDWLPQRDLLHHPKTKAFITHGGINSIQESIYAGVPMVCLALFSDQPKNAKVIEKLEISVTLKKSQITEETVTAAIREVLENERYSTTVKRLSRMVKKQPVSPKELLIKWTEFVAEFKTLDNLIPAGTELNWMQYYSLDVILFLTHILCFVILLLYKISRYILARIYRALKSENKLKTS